MRRILICGPRSWTNPGPIGVIIDRELETTRKEDLLVIVGGAAGVDLLTEPVCHSRGVHTARVQALWDTYHRGAGPRRNGVMLSLEPHQVYAFHFSRESLWENGSGTGRCVKQALAKDIPVAIKLVLQEVADSGYASYLELQAAKAATRRSRKRKS